MLHNTVRYHIHSSFASLCKILTFLSNYMEEGMHTTIPEAKHMTVRNKFLNQLDVTKNSFGMCNCRVPCDIWLASPGNPK